MDQVAQIRDKVDIVSLIGEYITLKKAGKNFHALCPFHGEKTPSFVVSPDRQIWHCFGCSKGGDVYTFLMDYEHMEFPEALRVLAKQTGIELVSTNLADTTVTAKKESLYKANHLAAEFYHYILLNHPAGKAALEYLLKRGIKEQLIQTFKIGYSPSSGKALVRYLIQKKRFNKDDLFDSGLVTSHSSGISDFFRGRLMFPLIDHRDNILGFSGRLLDEKTGFGGKYINTRDTLIYHKREHFFGLNVTKEAIRKANKVLLVEGEFDVMSCFQNGISNVIAVKGTALTDQQVNLISRYAEKVMICFDGDSAGQEAIKRSLPILAKKKLNTSVVVIPSGKDPDDALKTSPVEFKKAVEHDINVYDYLFESAIKNNDASKPEGKQKISAELLPVIAEIENAIVKEHYLRKLSSSLQTSYESIVAEMEKQKRKVVLEDVVTKTRSTRSRDEVLEEFLLALLLQSPDLKKAAEILEQSVINILDKQSAYQKLIQLYYDYAQKTDESTTDKMAVTLPTELMDAYNTALLFPIPAFSDSIKYFQEIDKIATQLRTVLIKAKIKKLTEQMSKIEKEGSEQEIEAIKNEYSRMVSMLKK